MPYGPEEPAHFRSRGKRTGRFELPRGGSNLYSNKTRNRCLQSLFLNRRYLCIGSISPAPRLETANTTRSWFSFVVMPICYRVTDVVIYCVRWRELTIAFH